jgi:hypothetical protein
VTWLVRGAERSTGTALGPGPRAPGLGPVLIHAHSTIVKELGDWTTACRFDVRVRGGQAVLDLRSAQIPAGDIRLDAERGLLRLLVAGDARLESADLRWIGRGRLKDLHGASAGSGRAITITGEARRSEIRVHRGGMAVVASMFDRGELRRMHRVHEETKARLKHESRAAQAGL